MNSCPIDEYDLQQTGFYCGFCQIGGKYKMIILYALSQNEVVRFNELKKWIGNISYKTLSTALKELEADGLIDRKAYPQIPPKVEYSLSDRGRSLIPILDSLDRWGKADRSESQ